MQAALCGYVFLALYYCTFTPSSRMEYSKWYLIAELEYGLERWNGLWNAP